jgi:hypothetical protein
MPKDLYDQSPEKVEKLRRIFYREYVDCDSEFLVEKLPENAFRIEYVCLPLNNVCCGLGDDSW